MSGARVVLASASPRRIEMLGRIGIEPAKIRPADIDETVRKGELPRAYCRRMAESKAMAVDPRDGEVVLAADTIVALGRRILGKPDDECEAEAFLRLLSGRRHKVLTAVAVRMCGTRLRTRDIVSVVRMKRLTDCEIRAYLDSREWIGKAGGYGIQGRAEALIPWISGSHSAIVGLPLAETAALLRSAGVAVK